VVYRARVFLFAAGAALILSGCQSASSDDPASVAPDTPDAIEEVEEVELIPEFYPNGDARENQPYIDYVVQGVVSSANELVDGMLVVEALEEAGFDRASMELTPRTSLIALPADSTSLAIKIDDVCVITQWSATWYASSLEPVLVTGTCLLGDTVSLD
jgi:hypothetical protein